MLAGWLTRSSCGRGRSRCRLSSRWCCGGPGRPRRGRFSPCGRRPMAPASLSDAYRRFWQEVGAGFPDLGGAASTAYYFENEKRLLSEHVPDLGQCAVLKTDLWDEVKNTRILTGTSSSPHKNRRSHEREEQGRKRERHCSNCGPHAVAGVDDHRDQFDQHHELREHHFRQ